MSKLKKKIEKRMGVVFFSLIIVLSSSALIYGSTTAEAFSGKRLYYDTTAYYTGSFQPTVTESISPYIAYINVYANGYYYVGGRYKTSNYNYYYYEANKYYASSIATGKVVSVPVQAHKENQIYIKGTSDLFMDIDYMRYTYN